MARKRTPKQIQALGRAVERFRSGDLGPVVEIAKLKRTPPVPFDTWSRRNQVIAYYQSDSTDLRTVNKWNEVGRRVIKGRKVGAYIYQKRLKRETDEDTGKDRWVPTWGYNLIPEYRYEDTEGDPLPEGQVFERPIMPLTDLADGLGIDTRMMPAVPGALGSTKVDGLRITLSSSDPYVWFHELGHAVHARVGGKLKGGQHVDQEVVADFTAVVLMELYGLGDMSGHCWNYIKQYAEDPCAAMEASLETIEQVLDYLFPSETKEAK